MNEPIVAKHPQGLFRWLMVGSLILFGGVVYHSRALADTLERDQDVSHRGLELLRTYCGDCHAHGDGEAGFELPKEDVQSLGELRWNATDVIEHWDGAHLRVERRMMPPEDADQPTATERKLMLAAIDQPLRTQVAVGGTTPRRLNAREYQNTIRSVFSLPGFELPNSFPQDRSAQGFDTLSSQLVLSGTHLEAWNEAATLVADEFFPPPTPPVTSRTIAIPAKHLAISYSSGMRSRSPESIPEVRLASSGANLRRHAIWPDRFEAPAHGKYRIRIAARTYGEPPGQPALLRVQGAILGRNSSSHNLGDFEVTANGTRIEFDADLEVGETITLRYLEGGIPYEDVPAYRAFLDDLMSRDPRLAAAWKKVGKPARGGSGWQQVQRVMAEEELDVASWTGDDSEAIKRRSQLVAAISKDKVASGETLVYRFFENGPGIAIQGLEIEGPVELLEDRRLQAAAKRRNGLVPKGVGRGDDAALREFLHSFLQRLFRRPPEASEVERYARLYQSRIQETESHEAAMHLCFRMALVSPAFLYREVGSPGSLDRWQLASRLSYGLTGGPPDARLHQLLSKGELSDVQVVRHADRLLGRKFCEDFVAQWLGLDAIDALMPDPSLIKRFTADHRYGMRQEPIETFEWVIEKNLPISTLIQPDFVLTNGLVAKEMYGLKSGKSKQDKKNRRKLQRFPVDPEDYRGGLLSMPGIMMATANGVDTQPVLRGVWALDNILGQPVPEPPKSVPALTPDTTGATTPKERLAAHMSDASCASCHSAIDPVGFVLENFDAIGRWRTHYPASGSDSNQPGMEVDATGQLMDGTALQDVRDLKRWLGAHPETLAQCLSEKFLTYVCGREMNYRERAMIATIVDEQKSNDLRLRDLLLALIESPIFKTR